MVEFGKNLWLLTLEAAPWLLLGLVVAGLMRAVVPVRVLRRWLGGGGVGPIVRAAVVGTPIPVCSCGVLPIALGLRRQGASPGATVSFLIATPENGADSIAVSYALLGPFFTVVRPVAALASAVATGVAAMFVAERASGGMAQSRTGAGAEADSCGGGCCGTEAEAEAQTEAAGGCADGGRAGEAAESAACGEAEPAADCCGGGDCCDRPMDRDSAPLGRRVRDGLRYALTDIFDDLLVWLAVGLVLAAVVQTLVPTSALAEWGGGLWVMLAMVVVGMPMYICATASTPVAAAMLLAGLSPGTVLVFLLAGPATNVGTMGVIRREMGTGVLAAYLAGIAATSVGLGLGVDALVAAWEVNIAAQVAATGEWVPAWVAIGSVVVLAGLALRWAVVRLGRWRPGPEPSASTS